MPSSQQALHSQAAHRALVVKLQQPARSFFPLPRGRQRRCREVAWRCQGICRSPHASPDPPPLSGSSSVGLSRQLAMRFVKQLLQRSIRKTSPTTTRRKIPTETASSPSPPPFERWASVQSHSGSPAQEAQAASCSGPWQSVLPGFTSALRLLHLFAADDGDDVRLPRHATMS